MSEKYLNYLLNERKLMRETIEAFNVGCMDKSGAFHAFGKDFPNKLVIQTNEFFRDAIFYPVYDLYGNSVAISARRLDGTEPKCMNTIYNKSYHLFGLNQTYKYILEKQEVFVVEGNVDFLQLYQSGIKNVVALLGSNLSSRHICLLSRFAKKLWITPDGDGGGDKFRVRAKKLLDKSDITFKFVSLPRGYDPDKYVKENGVEKFLGLPRLER